MEKIEISETLDTTTCPQCGSLDGKVIAIKDVRVGENVPPFHPRCRGCTVPYFDDDFFPDTTRAARNPETGKTEYVEHMNYSQWKEKYVDNKISNVGSMGLGSGGNSLSNGIAEHQPPQFLKQIDFENEKEVKNVLQNFEKSAINESIETACVITKSGEVYKCYGTINSVYPDVDLGDKLYGAIVSHNHPIAETEFSFSTNDLMLFNGYNLRILRGCDEKYIYEFSRDSNVVDDDNNLEISFENNQHFIIISKAKVMNIGYRRWRNVRE